ncbi:MAG: hypothetical protein LBC18_09985 [Opitutaceae bacterium]|jgi:hypothetical protein|nr:hypothetical protein [Opitutaceae bacterium]
MRKNPKPPQDKAGSPANPKKEPLKTHSEEPRPQSRRSFLRLVRTKPRLVRINRELVRTHHGLVRTYHGLVRTHRELERTHRDSGCPDPGETKKHTPLSGIRAFFQPPRCDFARKPHQLPMSPVTKTHF